MCQKNYVPTYEINFSLDTRSIKKSPLKNFVAIISKGKFSSKDLIL